MNNWNTSQQQGVSDLILGLSSQPGYTENGTPQLLQRRVKLKVVPARFCSILPSSAWRCRHPYSSRARRQRTLLSMSSMLCLGIQYARIWEPALSRKQGSRFCRRIGLRGPGQLGCFRILDILGLVLTVFCMVCVPRSIVSRLLKLKFRAFCLLFISRSKKCAKRKTMYYRGLKFDYWFYNQSTKWN